MKNVENSRFKLLLEVGSALAKLATVVLLIAIATAMAMLFKSFGFHESNIIITYLLAVLLISYWIEGYLYGVLASVLGVLTFNFFFTEPYYSLLAYRQDYPVTFAIMLFAAVLVSTITSKMKRESRLSRIREKRAYVLYKIAQGLLRAQGIEEICQIVGKEVSSILNVAVMISLKSEGFKSENEWIYYKGEVNNGYFYVSDLQRGVATQVYKTGSVLRYYKETFDDLDFYYAPIIGQKEVLGVLGISLKPNEIIYEEKETLIKAMTSQIGMALERVLISEAQKKQHVEIEAERLRSNLLRAISHDLRTPLTGILGAATTLIAHEKLISEEQRRSLLEDIAEDSQWLVQSVENILSMTKFDEGKVELHLKTELIDDLVLEALNRFKVNESGREIEVNLPDQLIALEVDGHLIEQVLVNLVDNAIKYTPTDSKIEVEVTEKEGQIIFRVRDHGSGILDEHIPLLFNRFFTAGISSDRGKNGIGLGLEICKSIVEAHDGHICAYNNDTGGACFEFSLPLRRTVI